MSALRRLPTGLLLLLAACAAPAEKHAGAPAARVLQGDEQVEIDRLKLAAVLIRDGHYDRAEAELQQVDASAEGLDRARFFTLRGLVGLHRQTHATARDDFRAAIAHGQREPIVQVYLAQALYALQSWQETLEALDAAGESAAKFPALHAMRIQCCWKLKDVAGAFGALSEAEFRFPDQPDFTRQRLHYLLELGFNKEAVETGRAYLERAGGTMRAYLALGEALRRAKQLDAALEVLENARLRHPSEEQILVALAHAYLDKGLPRSAGRVLEEAAAEQVKYASEAAELYRRGGELRRALYLNAGLDDQKVKARQRLGLLLEAERFEEAVSLEERLARLGLIGDEDVRYALAYIRFRTGDFDRAEEHLKALTRADLFQAASELRKAIDTLREDASGR